MEWTSPLWGSYARPKIVLSFTEQIYGRLKVSTRNLAIWARVTEFSGQ